MREDPPQGAAAQALIRMNAIAFARTSGFDYVHTPFSEIAHADRPIGEWVSAWESLFNLGAEGDRLKRLKRVIAELLILRSTSGSLA